MNTNILGLLGAIMGPELFAHMGVQVKQSTKDQALLLAQISGLSGVVIINDALAAFKVFGKEAPNVRGALMSTDKNPMCLVDMIIMNTDINSPRFLRVLAHELSHATGTQARLARRMDTVAIGHTSEGVSADYAIEELTAETSARQVLKNLGFDTPELLKESQDYTNKIWERFKIDLPDVDLTLIEKRVQSQADAASAMVTDWMQPIAKAGLKAA